MRRQGIFVLIAAAFAPGAEAHHSLSATYDTRQTIELKGKIVQFLFRNPHSYLHIEAPDEDGVVQRWSFEWRDAGSLRQQGFGRSTLTVGDEVVITAHPSRTKDDHRGVLRTLYRTSDGLGWGQRDGETVE